MKLDNKKEEEKKYCVTLRTSRWNMIAPFRMTCSLTFWDPQVRSQFRSMIETVKAGFCCPSLTLKVLRLYREMKHAITYHSWWYSDVGPSPTRKSFQEAKRNAHIALLGGLKDSNESFVWDCSLQWFNRTDTHNVCKSYRI